MFSTLCVFKLKQTVKHLFYPKPYTRITELKKSIKLTPLAETVSGALMSNMLIDV